MTSGTLGPRQESLAGAPIVYDRVQRRPAPQLQARDLEIMRALWRYDFLTTSQIGAEWWAGCHHSRPQIRLAELTGAGLLTRFRPLVRRGTHQWIYQLARAGFREAQRCYGPDGAYIDETLRWSERRAVDMRAVEHELRVNEWMLAYRRVVGGRVVDWLGRREARAAPAEAERDPQTEAMAVAPDAAALIELNPRSAPLELLVELEREERPVRLAERLRRYDALLSEWWRSVPRFRLGERAPAVLFVAPSYRNAERLLRAADVELVKPAPEGAVPPAQAEAPAREQALFCAEPDVQRGSLRAWMLPAQPPGARGSEDFTAREVRLPG